MSKDIEYGLKEPFDIDGGELDGISPQEVFCLGYEWRKLEEQLESGEPVHTLLHSANKQRSQRMCIRRDRKCKIEDTAPGWCEIMVEPK